jgi:hypothetical protein
LDAQGVGTAGMSGVTVKLAVAHPFAGFSRRMLAKVRVGTNLDVILRLLCSANLSGQIGKRNKDSLEGRRVGNMRILIHNAV